MTYALGGAAPLRLELFAARDDRPAVAVTFNPQPTPLSLRAARRAVGDIIRQHGEDAMELAADAFSAALIRHNILSWEGIGDDRGEPVQPTQDVIVRNADGEIERTDLGTISAFLADPRLFEAADREYVLPWTQRDAEKNASAPSPGGTGARATRARTIAPSAAMPGASDDAAPTGRPEPRAARTTRKRATRTKAKPSGN